MQREWLKKNKEIPSVVTSLYNDAKLNGAWIYHKVTRRFYTPDEFLKDWSTIYFEGRRGADNRDAFQIMNPMAAIRQRAEWVAKASAELQEIMRKLEQYQAQFKVK
ncbi:hypothetical protein K7A41_00180 [Sphingobacterium sp. InxBP1]|uniref:hypothetical protein n=1 Tax=Sphingobacterium sp. InxBP1 TaxID=2870328 RepID=UPI002243577E|nr:hypothetical protein [Sphingobacterium sp. InxBP1]MCW8309643.1 hypothetical protein [Sphingobacterium sp. InxBP1]